MQNNRSEIRIGFVLGVVSWLSFITGCGDGNPKTYPVDGRVIFEDGKVAEIGTVEFRMNQDENRIIARGVIRKDGSFSMSTFEPGDGAVEGKHQAIVQQMVISEGLGPSHQHGPRVPKKYADYSTSGLQVEVKPIEKNQITIKLEVE
jgi:hypothetical protein